MKQKYCAEGDIGGTDDNAWRESLPNVVKDWDEAKNSTSEKSFWEQMANMRSLMGQSIRVPGEDASKEDKDAFNNRLMEKVPNLMQKPDFDDSDVMESFYQQMGKPAEAKEYSAPELNAPDGIILQEGLADNFKDIAHKHNLNQKQYEGVVRDYSNSTVIQAEQELAQHQKAMKGLNDEWGMKYEDNMEKAEAIRSKYFGDVVPNLDVAGADTVKAFSKIAERFGKEGMNGLIEERREHSSIVAPAEAQERLDELMGNKEGPLWNASDPGHQQAKEKMVKLTKMANPGMSDDVNDLRSH